MCKTFPLLHTNLLQVLLLSFSCSPIARRTWRLPRSGDSLVDDDYSHECSPPSPPPTPAFRSVASISRSPHRRAAHRRQGTGHGRHGVPPPRWPRVPRPLSWPLLSFHRQSGSARARGDAAKVSSSPVLLGRVLAHRRQAGCARSARLLRLAGSASSIKGRHGFLSVM